MTEGVRTSEEKVLNRCTFGETSNSLIGILNCLHVVQSTEVVTFADEQNNCCVTRPYYVYSYHSARLKVVILQENSCSQNVNHSVDFITDKG